VFVWCVHVCVVCICVRVSVWGVVCVCVGVVFVWCVVCVCVYVCGVPRCNRDSLPCLFVRFGCLCLIQWKHGPKDATDTFP